MYNSNFGIHNPQNKPFFTPNISIFRMLKQKVVVFEGNIANRTDMINKINKTIMKIIDIISVSFSSYILITLLISLLYYNKGWSK